LLLCTPPPPSHDLLTLHRVSFGSDGTCKSLVPERASKSTQEDCCHADDDNDDDNYHRNQR
jgi:hypothetical protein